MLSSVRMSLRGRQHRARRADIGQWLLILALASRADVISIYQAERIERFSHHGLTSEAPLGADLLMADLSYPKA